jgi:phage recombination protein Bet
MGTATKTIEAEVVEGTNAAKGAAANEAAPLTVVHPSRPAADSGGLLLTFTAEQERIICDSFMGGASPSEAALLLMVCKRRGLDPFKRSVHFVKRWDSAKRDEVWAIQPSIDGLRSIAERTGLYDGQDEAQFETDPKTGALVCCRVRVYRKDWNRPAVGVAYWAEFVQTTRDGKVTAMWARMPHVMLAKCAEALALRKAFPEDTGGLYVPEEMPAEERQQEEKTKAPAKRAAPAKTEPAPELEAKPEPKALPAPEAKLEPTPEAKPLVIEPLDGTDAIYVELLEAFDGARRLRDPEALKRAIAAANESRRNGSITKEQHNLLRDIAIDAKRAIEALSS